MHLAATAQSLILAGESPEVDTLAQRATLVKGQSGGAVVLSDQSAANATNLGGGGDAAPGPIINYELWVSTGSSALPSSCSPVDLYKRIVQSASLSRPKILDVFA